MNETEQLILLLTQCCYQPKILCYVATSEPWLSVTPALLVVVSPHPIEINFVNPKSRHVRNEYIDRIELKSDQFDFVYLNQSHSLDIILGQIECSMKSCSPGFILLLPGISPPSRGMVGPVPTEAWWLGERWAIVDTLKTLGVQVFTTAIAPTGLLVAYGLVPIDALKAIEASIDLHHRVQTQSEFEAYFTHSSPTHILHTIQGILPSGGQSGIIKLIIDPLELAVVSTVIDEFKSWVRPDPMFVVDLSEQSHDISPLYNNVRSIHGVTIDEFTNACLLGRDLIAIGSEEFDIRRIYGKNKAMIPMLGTLRTVSNEDGGDACTLMTEMDGEFFYPAAALEDAITLYEDIFLGTPDEHLNYGMWLIYSVPSISHFRKLHGRYTKYLVGRSASWQENLLLGLGLHQDELIMGDIQRTYKASRVATMRQTYRSLALSASDREAFDEAGHRFGGEGTEPSHERIYVSRRSWPGHRPLLNENELIEGLNGLGYIIIEPHKLPINEQIRLFRNAKSIIGLGGAAMFNVAFCQPGVQVIDIESDMGFIDYHASLFASRGVHYGLVLGQVDASDDTWYHKRWTVDVAGVLHLVRKYG